MGDDEGQRAYTSVGPQVDWESNDVGEGFFFVKFSFFDAMDGTVVIIWTEMASRFSLSISLHCFHCSMGIVSGLVGRIL